MPRKSTGPRTPSAKRRAAATRHRDALVEATLALPPHRLAQAHLRADEAAQFFAADPALAAEIHHFLLLCAQYSWIVRRIGAFTHAFLTAPAPYEYLHANLGHLDLLLRARRRLAPRIDTCLRGILPAYDHFIQHAPAPPPAATRAASA